MHDVMDWSDLVMLLLALTSALVSIYYGRKLHRVFLMAKAVPFLWFSIYYSLSLTDTLAELNDAHVVMLRPAMAMLLIFFLLDTAHDRIERAMAWLARRI